MQIAQVRWLDSTTFHEWENIETVDKASPRMCVAVGFLITENEDKITLALLATDDFQAFSNWIVIPAKDIVDREILIRECRPNEGCKA
jgi:hypothetical protein